MYARFTGRLNFRLSQPYKDMLAELSVEAKSPMSTIARDIFEQGIERRYNKLKSPPISKVKKTVAKKVPFPMVFGKRSVATTVNSVEKETGSADS